jgi:hypothetical protein
MSVIDPVLTNPSIVAYQREIRKLRELLEARDSEHHSSTKSIDLLDEACDDAEMRATTAEKKLTRIRDQVFLAIGYARVGAHDQVWLCLQRIQNAVVR